MDMKPITTTELVEQFILYHYHRPRTTRTYRQVAKIFVRDTGVELAHEITTETIRDWRTIAIEQRLVSASTWNNYVRHLRSVLNYAAHQGILSFRENPVSRMSISQPVRRKRTVSRSDWDRVVAFLEENRDAGLIDPQRDQLRCSWLWLTLLHVADTTGMRLRQLVALQWRDVDFDRKIICLRVEGSKTNREWEIPMQDSVGEDLRYLLKRTTQLTGKYNPTGQVFNVNLFSEHYKLPQLNDSQVCNFCARIFRLTGIRISPHRLRHSLATELMREPDRDLPTVQKLLGHTSIRTTLEYVTPDVEQMRKLVNSCRR